MTASVDNTPGLHNQNKVHKRDQTGIRSASLAMPEMTVGIGARASAAGDSWPAEFPHLPRVPTHVAIKMDGNGRWARARNLPRIAGHRRGTKNLRPILEASVQFGIRIVTVYAFSTENWNRPQAEVEAILTILGEAIKQETPELHANGVQIRHLGSLEGVPTHLAHRIKEALDLTRHNQRLILNVAFNYGGRAEIVRALRGIIRAGLPAESVTEDTVSRYLYTAGQPDPDLIILPGGEMRSSNFLTWQSIYSEVYVTPVLWPAFGVYEYYQALAAYSQRVRRFGRVLPETTGNHQPTGAPGAAKPNGTADLGPG